MINEVSSETYKYKNKKNLGSPRGFSYLIYKPLKNINIKDYNKGEAT